MATLTYHWKLDDGSGTTAAEAVASNDMDITVVSGSPNWVTGGLEFNGEAFGATGTPRAVAESYGYGGCSIDVSGATFVVRFKLTSTNYGFLFGSCVPPTGSVGPRPVYGFYVGSDNTLYFASTCSTGTGADYILCVNTGVVNDGAEHVGVCQIKPESSPWLQGLYIWLDGVLVESKLTALENKYKANADKFYLGMADLYSASPYAYWEGIGTLQPGTIDAIIYDARFYCGVLTEDEIKHLYDSQNAIMFSCNT